MKVAVINDIIIGGVKYMLKRGNMYSEILFKMHRINYEKEYRFHPVRKWRFDFAIPEHMIAIEIEGGIYMQGRHTRGKGYQADCEKYREAVVLGWRLLRYTTNELAKDSEMIIRDIERLLS